MNYRHPAEKRLDAVIGRRLLNGCWFATNTGVSILQMRLIAQSWFLSGLALAAALVASAWLVGSLVGAMLSSRRQQAVVLPWGLGLLACALLALLLPPDGPRTFNLWLGVGELALLALIMGLTSTAWLVQRRPWPPVGERVALAKGALATMLGLGAVWLLPRWWSGGLEIACLCPLLLLDCWPAARAPLPVPGRMVDNWYDTTAGADRWRLNLKVSDMLRWWWAYLAKRGQRSLVFIASSVSIALSAIWSAVPTPFAGLLLAGHQITTLAWLIAAQVVTLALGLGCFLLFRGVLGPADRLIPVEWREHCKLIALAMLLLMACCLLALGLPELQAPWWLALSLGLYTLAATAWGILLPRLKPSLSTLIFSQRHQSGQLDKGMLAYERAQEEYVNRILFTLEGLLTALLAPLIGWLVDRQGVDGVLIVCGRLLLLFLVLSAVVIGLRQYIGYIRLQKQQAAGAQRTWEAPPARVTPPPAPRQRITDELQFVEDVQMFLQQKRQGL